MKIGILTFHSALNVGAVLQAYSLQQYLLGCGYEVEFIDYQPGHSPLNFRNFIGKSFKQTLYKWQDLYNKFYYSRNNRFNNLLNCGRRTYLNLSNLKSHPPECDVYIAGSDQIWNFNFSRKFDAAFFLDFGSENIIRVAFSASMGQNCIPKAYVDEFAENLKRFDFLSVREKNSAKLISQLTENHSNVEHICDPTFLLNKYQLKIVEEDPEELGEFIVSYVLPHYDMGKALIKALHFVERELGKPLINIKNPNTCQRFEHKVNRVVTPQKWLGYFKHANFTICCSFHAVVFSLIYKKPFIVISPYENHRILSLLEAVGLSHRCVYDFDSKKIRFILSDPINWKIVDNYFIKERNRSEAFLKNALDLPSSFNMKI